MVKVQNPLNRVINYTYDGNNNLTQKRINDLVATYKYDSANNIVEESNEYGYTEMFEYDDFGNLTNYVKPDGTEITYEFDLLGNKLKKEAEHSVMIIITIWYLHLIMERICHLNMMNLTEW